MPEDTRLHDGTVHLEPSAMERWEAYFSRSPEHRKMRDLIVQYATAQGDLTLEYWKRNSGHYFGLPIMMLSDKIADELDVPVSELDRILRETNAAVLPELQADSDYQAFRSRRSGLA